MSINEFLRVPVACIFLVCSTAVTIAPTSAAVERIAPAAQSRAFYATFIPLTI